MGTDVQDIFTLDGVTELRRLREQLGSVGILDIGQCYDYKPSTGKCSVVTSKMIGKRRVRYHDVEVLYAGGVFTPANGSLCLLFVPRACVLSTRDMQVDFAAGDFSKTAAKCIPLSNGTAQECTALIEPGEYTSINGEAYNLMFTPWGYTLTLGDEADSAMRQVVSPDKYSMSAGSLHEDTYPDGSKDVWYLTSDDKVLFRYHFAADGTVTEQHLSQADITRQQLDDIDAYTDYAWTDEWATDGTHTKTLRGTDNENVLRVTTESIDGTRTDTLNNADGNPIRTVTEDVEGIRTDILNDADGNPIRTVTENADGSSEEVLSDADGNALLTISRAADSTTTITQTDGSDTLNTITLAASGDITLTNNGSTTITIGIDGTLNIETGDAVTCKAGGALSVEAGDDIKVKPGSKLTIDGELEVTKAITGNDACTIKGKFSAAGGNLTADA